MATVSSLIDRVSRLSGIPPSSLRTTARRLGESGLIPRGGRGESLQALSTYDCARFIVASMRVALGGATVRADQHVREAERLQSKGDIQICADDGSIAFINAPGSLVRQLESLITELATQEKTKLLEVVAAIGLTIGARGFWGWVELRRPSENEADTHVVDVASGLPRIIFAEGKVDRSGLICEVRITSEALSEIADMYRPGQSGTRDG